MHRALGLVVLAVIACTGQAAPQTIATPAVPRTSPSATTVAATPSPSASGSLAFGFLEFNPPQSFTGDWVFAIKAGLSVRAGREPLGELWTVPLSGGTARLIARYTDFNDGSELRANILRRQMSADHRRLVLSSAEPRGRSVISVIELGAGTAKVVAQDAGADLIRPALSPDGTRIAYVRKVGSRDEGLWLINADGTGARQLRPGVEGLYTWTYGWTPDSRGLAFDQVGSTPSYVVLDVASGARTDALGFANVLWGEPVAWRGRVPSLAAGLADRAFEGEFRIVVADGATNPQRVIADESNHHLILDSPRWHPTLDEILYRRLITVVRTEFYVIPAAGGAPQPVPLAQKAWLADWTPDGAGIVYIAQDTGGYSWLGTGVRVAKRDGSGDRELLVMPDGALSDLLAVRYPG